MVIAVDSISFQLPITQLPISVAAESAQIGVAGAGVGRVRTLHAAPRRLARLRVAPMLVLLLLVATLVIERGRILTGNARQREQVRHNLS